MKPLSKRRRTISMVGLLILFIVLVPILVAYSSGYRFNFEDFIFTKTGGIFIHSELSGTKVFLDDTFVEDNGVILRSTLIQNLKSEALYRIRVEKEDHHTWHKDLYVHPNLVTEATILMLPKEIPFEEIEQLITLATSTRTRLATTASEMLNPEYTNIHELFMSTTSTDEIITTESRILADAGTVATSVSTRPKRIKKLPRYIQELPIENIAEKKLLQYSGRIVAWLEGGDVHVMWAGGESTTPFYFCDIRGCRDKILVSLDTDIEHYDFFPERTDVLVVKTMNDIFAVEVDDRSKQNVQPIFKSDPSTGLGTGDPEFKLVGNTIFIKDGEALLRAEI